MQCCVPRCRNRGHRGRPAECRCAGPRDWLSHQWKRVTDMLPGRKRRMAAGNTRDLEKDSPDCLSPCETTGQVPQTGKEAEPSLEAYMALQVSQDNMGVPDAQGRRQPPPKPPRRNKGRVIWYSGSCPYSDWPPLLEDQPQVGPGPQEPEGELQPVQQSAPLLLSCQFWLWPQSHPPWKLPPHLKRSAACGSFKFYFTSCGTWCSLNAV
ncbi:uncharacterized protein LOC132533160 [Erinaceus europaeus]|uniref:Uncharacterized protein LOC132533160 n=1 Tax=Erinaceus europaeus TaxID=9365 RepID=A0ABM3VZE3_ERIEU|nr:uncharacterized protein LOC132533160 [Erinaceus europaeus]